MNLPDLELIVKMLSILHQSDGPSMPFKASILQPFLAVKASRTLRSFSVSLSDIGRTSEEGRRWQSAVFGSPRYRRLPNPAHPHARGFELRVR